MHRLGATEPLAALLARDPATNVPLNDLLDLAKLLTSLHKAGAEEQVAALAARMSAVSVDRDNLEDLETLVDELWESGAKEHGYCPRPSCIELCRSGRSRSERPRGQHAGDG